MEQQDKEALKRELVTRYNRDLRGPDSREEAAAQRRAETADFLELIRLLWLADDDDLARLPRAMVAIRWLGERGRGRAAQGLQPVAQKGPPERALAAQEAIQKINERVRRGEQSLSLWPPPPELCQGELFPAGKADPPPAPGTVSAAEAARLAEQDELLNELYRNGPDAEGEMVRRLGEIGDVRAAPMLYQTAGDRKEECREQAAAALAQIKERVLTQGWPSVRPPAPHPPAAPVPTSAVGPRPRPRPAAPSAPPAPPARVARKAPPAPPVVAATPQVAAAPEPEALPGGLTIIEWNAGLPEALLLPGGPHSHRGTPRPGLGNLTPEEQALLPE